MALDGIVVASLAKELQENFTNARLSKIAQPEKDELLLHSAKVANGQKRLAFVCQCIFAAGIYYRNRINQAR